MRLEKQDEVERRRVARTNAATHKAIDPLSGACRDCGARYEDIRDGKRCVIRRAEGAST